MDTLSRMRCFLKVVDEGGFSAAARALGRSKALVSKYVGELEDELGARLLNRTTRQISMTEVGHAFYKEAIAYCEQVRDYVTREIFERILEDEEEHIDFLETQLELVKTVGLQNYLQSQMGEQEAS